MRGSPLLARRSFKEGGCFPLLAGFPSYLLYIIPNFAYLFNINLYKIGAKYRTLPNTQIKKVQDDTFNLKKMYGAHKIHRIFILTEGIIKV